MFIDIFSRRSVRDILARQCGQRLIFKHIFSSISTRATEKSVQIYSVTRNWNLRWSPLRSILLTSLQRPSCILYRWLQWTKTIRDRNAGSHERVVGLRLEFVFRILPCSRLAIRCDLPKSNLSTCIICYIFIFICIRFYLFTPILRVCTAINRTFFIYYIFEIECE